MTRYLLPGSLLWLILVLLVPLSQEAWAAYGTFFLVGINFLASLWTLVVHKKALLLLNLAQIGLFGLLHFQVFNALGSGHYHFDREPALWDWLEFTGAHVVRAADFLDVLEGYGIDLQNLKHASFLAGMILLGLHLTVDFFLLAVTIHGVSSWWRKRQRQTGKPASEENSRRWHRWLLRGLAASLAAVLACAVLQGWRGKDYLLWPLDNLSRTIDLADAMQIFHWKFHQVEAGFWTGSVGFVFRLTVGFFLARWLGRLHLKLLRHRALRPLEDYVISLEDADGSVRLAALTALGQIGADAALALPALIRLWPDDDWEVGALARRAVRRIGPAPGETLPDLIALLQDADWSVRRAAAEALGRMGAEARSAISPLIACLADPDPLLRQVAESALAQIHPCWPASLEAWQAVSLLVDKLGHHKPEVRRRAADVLGRLGQASSPGIPSLLRRLTDSEEYVRLSALWALDRIDPDWRRKIWPADDRLKVANP